MNSELRKPGCPPNNFTINRLAPVIGRPVRTVAFLILALIALLLVPIASAQRLDNVWFKVKLNAKGRSIDPQDGKITRINVSTPAYLHFMWLGTNAMYMVDVWTRTDSGWMNATTLGIEMIGPNENFVSDSGGTIHGPGGMMIHVYCTFFVSVKTDGSGAVQSGMFDGGGEIDYGTMEGNPYFGMCTVKGTVVKSSKLPFTP